MLSGLLGDMMARHALDGRIDRLFVRSARRSETNEVTSVCIDEDGLAGDHASRGKRAVTLLQAEHLAVVASCLGCKHIDPAMLRRNVIVSGINLLGLRKSRVQIGTCTLFVHGPCPPCSRMEEV